MKVKNTELNLLTSQNTIPSKSTIIQIIIPHHQKVGTLHQEIHYLKSQGLHINHRRITIKGERHHKDNPR